MDHIRVVKRAWKVLWSYPTLWLFGVILAVTTPSRGGSSYQFGRQDWGDLFPSVSPDGLRFAPQQLLRALRQVLAELSPLFRGRIVPMLPNWLVPLLVGLACLSLVLMLIALIVRYVSMTALIKLVDAYARTGEKLRFGNGWRLGWSRQAWHLFLITVLVTLPIFLMFLLLFSLAALPLLGWLSRVTFIGVLGTLTAIGLFLMVILAATVISVVVRVLLQLVWRTCALEDLGVLPAIGQGWEMLSKKLKDVGLMWLLAFGINLGYRLLLVPIILLLMAVGGIVAGLALLLTQRLVSLLVSSQIRWVLGGLVSAPLFLIVVILPLLFVAGLHQVFLSSLWTLTYRELTIIPTVSSGAPLSAEPAAA